MIIARFMHAALQDRREMVGEQISDLLVSSRASMSILDQKLAGAYDGAPVDKWDTESRQTCTYTVGDSGWIGVRALMAEHSLVGLGWRKKNDKMLRTERSVDVGVTRSKQQFIDLEHHLDRLPILG